ncbi:MAG: HEAT repeat domain-containing protein [Vicinamibacterales bacterium]|nr:HEAT repeat domain-containing protein [Vicinamibacterales bacterium]
MTDRATTDADTTRAALHFARALTVALRSWSLYPSDHPAIGVVLERLSAACGEATTLGPLSLAVTPGTLLIDAVPLESPDQIVREAAALLHDRDILQIILLSPPPEAALRTLLTTLTLDREVRRTRGGPARIWADEGHSSLLIEQVDYQLLLEREGDDEGPARRDALWQSLVRSVIAGRSTIGELEQARLLEISRHVSAIGALAADCGAPFCTPDGAPLVTMQAATVLAVYRHIATTVSVLEPERAQEVLRTLARAAASLEPGVGLELLRQQDAPGDAHPLMDGLRQTFDDQQVALLLARSLATQGQATGRLAQVLETIAPDDERKRRVLRMAERLVSERDFGSARPIDDLRNSLEELLLKYDEAPYVSTQYQDSMEAAPARAMEMAVRELPPEMGAWTETLQHENVRQLSGQLLMDLLNIEEDRKRAGEIAGDMAGFVDDLVLAGAYDEATRLVTVLQDHARRADGIAPEACRDAVTEVGASPALHEAVGVLGEMDAAEAQAFGALALTIGPAVTATLLGAFHQEAAGRAGERAGDLIVRLGSSAVPSLTTAADDPRWFVQVQVAALLGRIGTAAAVPPLQTLLRRPDVRVLRAAVAALAGIPDAAAARALHTVLRSVRGETRSMVIAVLVGLKDPRVVPMLLHVLEDSRALGADHALVLETLAALATIRDDRAVPAIAALATTRRWTAWLRTRRLRLTALRTLLRLGTPASRAAFDRVVEDGGWGVRRLAARARKDGA